MDIQKRLAVGLLAATIALAIVFMCHTITHWVAEDDAVASWDEIDAYLQAIERYVQHVRAINKLQDEVNVKLPLALRWLELQKLMEGE